MKFGSIKIIKNKYFEWEFGKHPSLHPKLSFRLDSKTDHAGIHFSLSLFKYCIYLDLYDCRHWDYKNKCWEVK